MSRTTLHKKDMRLLMIGTILGSAMAALYDMGKNIFGEYIPPQLLNWSSLASFLISVLILFLAYRFYYRKYVDTGPDNPEQSTAVSPAKEK